MNSRKEIIEVKADELKILRAKVLLAALFAFVIVDYIWLQQYLFYLSIPWLKEIRENLSTPSLDLISELTAYIADKYGFAACIMLAYQTMDTPRAFSVTLSLNLSLGIGQILKFAYHEPRPFMVAPIFPSKCRFEYGNPSGHSITSMAMFPAMWVAYVSQYSQIGSCLYVLSFQFVLALLLAIAATRIYNGVHTIDQILNGWIWGFVIFYTCSIVFDKFLRNFVHRIRNRSALKLVWNAVTKMFLAGLVICLTCFVYINIYYSTPLEWFDNLMRNCPNLN